MFRVTNFDKLLERATSNLKLEPDWPTIMQICDHIRQGDVPVKVALNNIKKKMLSQNPHVATFALLVLESVVKNCGHHVHDEIATKAFMEQLRDLMKNTQNEQVKTKILELVQAWAFAFKSNSKYHAVEDTLTIMKAEGYKFPPLKESEAMFMAHTAPEWVDAGVCHRCRISFGVMVRKHHCRACGNVFCADCSSNTSTLPKFGIEKEVRVCKACYELHNKPRSISPQTKPETSFPTDYHTSSMNPQSQHLKPKKTEEELKEEEDIQLALALSQSEAEAKEKEKKRMTNEFINNASSNKKSSSTPATTTTTTALSIKDIEEEEDPELARYLNRGHWEKRQIEERNAEKKRSSPDHFRSSPGGPPSAPTTPTHHLNGEMMESELNEFVGYLKSQVEIFVNRMKSNSSRGRSISNDSSVQTLFMNVTMNHSTLLRYIHQQDDSRVYYEGLQDKLAQVKDAMMALDALRDEHRDKLRREAEEAERQKQLQMAQKLEIMRRRKQEYLQYQRQLAIQKMQEQEREMQMRQEQQKQQYIMGSLGMTPGYPTWDSKVPPMQSPSHQYGPQYQSLPVGNQPPTGYAIASTSGVPPPQPPHMPGMVSQPVMPPTVMPPSGPHSLPPQPSQRGPVPPQQGQPRVLNVQPNQPRPMPNQGIPPMHPHHIPPNFQGMPIPGQNPAMGSAPNSLISHSQSIIMPPNGHMPVGLPPGATPNVPMPAGAQIKMNMAPTTPQGIPVPTGPAPSMPMPSTGPMPGMPPQGSQHKMMPGHPMNPAMPPPPQGIPLPQGAPQGVPQSIPQGVEPQTSQSAIMTQNPHQQFHQVPPGGEQNHSGSTGELISFD